MSIKENLGIGGWLKPFYYAINGLNRSESQSQIKREKEEKQKPPVMARSGFGWSVRVIHAGSPAGSGRPRYRGAAARLFASTGSASSVCLSPADRRGTAQGPWAAQPGMRPAICMRALCRRDRKRVSVLRGPGSGAGSRWR